MADQKKKHAVRNSDSILEQLRDLGGGVGNSVKNDLFSSVATDALNSIFSPVKKDLKPGEEINLGSVENYPQTKQPISEIRRPDIFLFNSKEANLKQEVEAVRQELRKAASEIKELNSAVLEVEKAVALAPVKAGTYHISFFARLRSIIKLFRQQISESRVWLEACTSKKKKRGYWNMFKKHGTSFGMSNERAIATQAG